MHKWLYWYLWLLVIGMFLVFFGSWFYPEPRIIASVESVRSDVWHFHYPLKDFLSRSLKAGHLPWWHSGIGTGYPVLAEGQIGTFFLPNLILFGLLPTWLAWNVSYLVAIGGLWLGTLWVLRQLKIEEPIALVTTTIFSFSGFFVAHQIHLPMLQTVALFPWVFGLNLLLLHRWNARTVGLLALALSQQIFAGYFQIVFISLLTIGVYGLVSLDNWIHRFKWLRFLCISLGVSVAISAVQLIPTFELLGQADRLQTNQSLRFPYKIEHLGLFLYPHLWGNPADGTWPLPEDVAGIHWENSFYFGSVACLLAIYGVWHSRKVVNQAWWALLCFGGVLALAAYTPVQWLFGVPGFGSFRVQSRYLLATVWAAIYFLSLGLTQWIPLPVNKLKHHLGLGLIAVVLGTDLIWHWSSYHAYLPVADLIKEPEIVSYIEPGMRVITHPSVSQAWYQRFDESGWQDLNPYLWLKNGLAPNLNLLWSVDQAQVYAGLYPSNYSAYWKEIDNHLLELANVSYVLSAQSPLENLDSYQLTQTIQKSEYPETMYLFEHTSVPPRYRFIDHIVEAKDEQAARALIQEPGFQASTSAVVVDQSLTTLSNGEVFDQPKVVNQSQTQTLLEIGSNHPQWLLIADSYYPGWEFRFNNQPIEAYRANLNQYLVELPPHEGQLSMKYQPNNWLLAQLVSLVGVLLAGYLAWVNPRWFQTLGLE